jgi:hypothetical protein
MADIRLGGSKASSVTLNGIQGGHVGTGSGNHTVAIGNHQTTLWNRSNTFEVRTGEGTTGSPAGPRRPAGWRRMAARATTP